MEVFSQTVNFSYDASGNRTARWLEVKDMKNSEDSALLRLLDFKPAGAGELLSDVQVYPNPVSHEMHIDITRLGDEVATGKLCDVNGRPVLSFSNLISTNSINLETLAPGIYLLRVECKGEQRVWKIVVSD
ncbi:MAG: hypothetical protein A2X11_10910 [Bacteroidetes bacterium GWE2_42_24]|nr:MAG: hypothetical protein A2X11_10910 [Bacteroidetes bacterium GWE2_42_24]OFY32057.1 MAG: hypothetical protein A2X09_10475 [Bacteroidetes bacterium GWF2_43_11]